MDRSGALLTNRSCPNSWKMIRNVAGRGGRAVHAAIEACSGAAELADELLSRAGWSVDLAHPGTGISRFPDEYLDKTLGLVQLPVRTRNFPWATT